MHLTIVSRGPLGTATPETTVISKKLRMYLLNKNTIYDLPIHDSDLLNFNMSQSVDGRTELTLRIAFYPDEVHLLDKQIIDLLGKNNEADFCINNCTWINWDGYYNAANRDQFDYVELLQEPSILERYGTKKSTHHLKITFISGSTLECVYEKIGLGSCK